MIQQIISVHMRVIILQLTHIFKMADNIILQKIEMDKEIIFITKILVVKHIGQSDQTWMIKIHLTIGYIFLRFLIVHFIVINGSTGIIMDAGWTQSQTMHQMQKSK